MTNSDIDSEVYQVLLYYKFTPIADVEEFIAEHRSLCFSLGLRGRILVASQGINGTVSGTKSHCEAYQAALRSITGFEDIVFKVDEVSGHVFKKMFVREKKELVTFRAKHHINPAVKTGTHLSPAEFQQMLQRDDVVVVDGRTDYEWDIGHFRGALRPDINSFRDFPAWIKKNLSDAKDKPIITYCTGGIRCEMLTAYMLEEGFSDVYQLDGGIVSYGKDETTNGALWDGKCYVFDERVLVDINHTDDREIIGRCSHCGAPTETYVNCANLDCHEQHLSCDACQVTTQRSCSIECITASRREDISAYYPSLETQQ